MEKLLNLILQHWKRVLLTIAIIDLLVILGLLGVFRDRYDTLAASATEVARAATPPTATPTPTPWPGPGLRPTATPTLPPTPFSTDVLAESGFPVGFTPTPRPTREPVMISLPRIYVGGRGGVDVPVVNQIYYPEPFFPPGSNNACGPVALFAALQGLRLDVPYSRLRDNAVRYGFNAEGISKAGMVGTIIALNNELGQPLIVEYGNRYNTRSLTRHISRGGVVVVLVRVRKISGRYTVTSDYAGSIGHFLLVERINLKSKTVQFAGSTLGMTQVPLIEFIRSWTRNPNLPDISSSGWKSYLDNENPAHWALILKRS